MELIKLSPVLPQQQPRILISRQTITFNRDAAKLIGLTEGECIVLLQDKDHAGDIYISKGANGYMLHKVNRRYRINSRSLARRILQIVGSEKAVCPIGAGTYINGIKVHAIITKINYHGKSNTI